MFEKDVVNLVCNGSDPGGYIYMIRYVGWRVFLFFFSFLTRKWAGLWFNLPLVGGTSWPSHTYAGMVVRLSQTPFKSRLDSNLDSSL